MRATLRTPESIVAGWATDVLKHLNQLAAASAAQFPIQAEKARKDWEWERYLDGLDKAS